MEIGLVDLLLLCAAAFLAGAVDAVVGGGGLIQLPALLVVLPGAPVVALLGTNKLASIVGTAGAAVTYNRRISIRAPSWCRRAWTRWSAAAGWCPAAGAAGGAAESPSSGRAARHNKAVPRSLGTRAAPRCHLQHAAIDRGAIDRTPTADAAWPGDRRSSARASAACWRVQATGAATAVLKGRRK
jgi:hypothetical protein